MIPSGDSTGAGEERFESRMAQLGELAGGLAHEIKNPLSTIGINLSLMREDWAHAETARERRTKKKIELLQREVQRLEDILAEFLRFVTGVELNLQRTKLKPWLEEILEFVEPEARMEKVVIHSSLDPALPEVEIDANYMRQVLLNLIINARHAMRESGGELVVVTRRAPKGVVIEVIDSGHGMSPEVLARCFDAYFSTRKGGSGLGLAMVRRIVNEHGGRVEVDSEEGRGTRFEITLPLPAGEA